MQRESRSGVSSSPSPPGARSDSSFGPTGSYSPVTRWLVIALSIAAMDLALCGCGYYDVFSRAAEL